jgi:hypothetical protein
MAKNFQSVLGSATEAKKDTEQQIKKNITILPELKAFIPPLASSEFLQLEINILEFGCREAISLWEYETGKYAIIDGHNRYEICAKHNLDFKFQLIQLENIEDAKDWMINNQLGKRNVPEEVKAYLRGKQYFVEKNKQNFKGNQYTKSNQNSNNQKFETLTRNTSEKIAELYKVSAKTIQRDEKYALALDKITENNEVLKWKILYKELNVSKSQILEWSNLKSQEIQKIKLSLEKGIIPEKELNVNILNNHQFENNNVNNPFILEEKSKPSKEEKKESKKNTIIDEKKIYASQKNNQKLLQEIESTFKKLWKEPKTELLHKLKEQIAIFEKEFFG